MTLGRCIQSFSVAPQGEALAHSRRRLEAELLLSHVLSCRREDLYIRWDQKLNSKQLSLFQSLLKQRRAGRPIAYIIGEKEFYGHKFKILPGVFIPRPETETLISAVLSQKSAMLKKKPHILDLGCGSGCIGLTLLMFFPSARLSALDFNEKALQLSRINAQKMKVADRALFLNRDISPRISGIEKADIVTANPPYIAFEDPRAQKKTLCFEPEEALFSGERGLRHIRIWLKAADRILKPGGSYFFEIGAGQDISSLKEKNMQKTAQFRDLSRTLRVLEFRKKSNG